MPSPTNPTPPPAQPDSPKAAAVKAKVAHLPKGGNIEAKPLKFLGMQFDEEETKKFWNIIIQMVNSQIQKDKAKGVKAIKNFGKSPGDPDYDD